MAADSFSDGREGLHGTLRATAAALKRAKTAKRRLEASRARHDTRAWQVSRRERTRQLIELGGLVAKAGLVDLTDDDRAVLYGAFLVVAIRLSQKDGDIARNAWRERGRAAFDEDAAKRAR